MIRLTKLLILIGFSFSISTRAQCLLFDGNGVPSANPYWIDCTGGPFTVNVSSPTSYTNYTVNWGDGSPLDMGASLPAGNILTHTYPAVVDTYVVTFTSTSPLCNITGVVVVETAPTASVTTPGGLPAQGCAPVNLQFINASTGVSKTTKFTWSFGDGTSPVDFPYTNAGQTVSHLYAAGTVTCQTVVSLKAENYCNIGSPDIYVYSPVYVHDKDLPDILPDDWFKCSPDLSFTFTNNSTPNCPLQGNNGPRFEKWNFGNHWGTGHDSIVGWQPWGSPSPVIAYPGPGNYQIWLVDSSYCGLDSTTTFVGVGTAPVAGIGALSDTVCSNGSIIFINTSTVGYFYEWNFGDSPVYTLQPFGPVTHTYNTPGTYTVSVVAFVAGGANSCKDTARMVITVLPLPTASFSPSATLGCDSIQVSFTDNSTNAFNWSWDFGNGNIFVGQNPPAQTFTVGNYTVQLVVKEASGCRDSTTHVINVYQTPVIQFAPLSACAGNVVNFTDNSTSAPGDPILNWNWDFGDATPNSSLQNPTHTYAIPSTYSVILTANTAHCTGKDTVLFQVNPKPTMGFTKSPVAGCSPLSVQFINNTFGASSFNWNFGNGNTSTSTNPIELYTNTSTSMQSYVVTLVANNAAGCADSLKDTIRVYGQPQPLFTLTGNNACAPAVISFTNSSLGASTYVWDFGDGTPQSTTVSPAHTYQNQTGAIQNFTVTLYATNADGCTDSLKQTITILPEADFPFTPITSSGCAPVTVNFSATAGATQYDWDFGDGNSGSGQNPSHTYVNTGTSNLIFSVQLIATNSFGCKDTNTAIVTAFYPAVATLTVSPLSQPFIHPSVNVNLNTTVVAGNNHLWNFGDGNISTNPNPGTHTYTTFGTFDIWLYVTTPDGCKDSIMQTINIGTPVPIAQFKGKFEGCVPLRITPQNTSLYASTYQWDFGDGVGTSTAANPVYIYNTPGNYTLKLIAVGAGGTDTIIGIDSVIVHPKPVALFSIIPSYTLNVGSQPVTCQNQSTGASAYAWNFGDGSPIVFSANPSHVYNTPGQFYITLIAVTNKGCRDTFMLPQALTIEEDFMFEIPNAFTPDPAGGSSNGIFDPASMTNDIFHANVSSVKTYELTIYNRWGEVVFHTEDPKVGWDGYYKGKLCAQGTYVYHVKVVSYKDKTIEKTGDLLLLR